MKTGPFDPNESGARMLPGLFVSLCELARGLRRDFQGQAIMLGIAKFENTAHTLVPSVAVLPCIYSGARFLPAQLALHMTQRRLCQRFNVSFKVHLLPRVPNET